MPVGFDSIRTGAAGAAGGYEIDYSCRFNDNDSAYLTRTPGSAGNRRTFTISAWFKLANLASGGSGTANSVFVAGGGAAGGGSNNDNDNFQIQISDSNDKMYIAGWNTTWRATTRVFRDVAAWYHIVLAVDSTNGTAQNRLRIYINGIEIGTSDLGTNNTVAENHDFAVNDTKAQRFGNQIHGSGALWDGYMAECILIDGSQLAPASFGETNADTGEWVPIDPSGLTFGTNGFWLDFADSSALGNDVSGNNNDLTPSGLATNDQMTDTPTNNHCTMNPLALQGPATFAEGNLQAQADDGTASYESATGTMSVSADDSDGYYFEAKMIRMDQVYSNTIGVVDADSNISAKTTTGNVIGRDVYPSAWSYQSTGVLYSLGAEDSSGLATAVATDVVQVAIKEGNLWIGINDTWLSGEPDDDSSPSYSNLDGYNLVPGWSGIDDGHALFNFGQSAFAYTIPTGFKPWDTASLPDPTIKDPSAYFQTVLYTGNGTAIGSGGKAVTFSGNSDMQPDLVWIKNLDAADDHSLYDAARGTTKQLEMNNYDVETTEAEGVTTFGSDGFTVGSLDQVNTNTEDYVAWCWSAGNSGSSNTAGSINTTTTFVDTTAGISISTYTGTGSGATVGHGLGVTPATVLVIPRSNGDHRLISNWESGVTAYSEKLKFNDAEVASSNTQITAASSTTVTLGTDPNVNGSGRTYVAYCFAEVEGFSRFGSYTGNGSSNGPVVHCGFKPQFIIVKSTSQVANWEILDTARNTYNLATLSLRADNSNPESSQTRDQMDFLSNGFKLRTSYSNHNTSGHDYVFMAFAETPFKYATAR